MKLPGACLDSRRKCWLYGTFIILVLLNFSLVQLIRRYEKAATEFAARSDFVFANNSNCNQTATTGNNDSSENEIILQTNLKSSKRGTGEKLGGTTEEALQHPGGSQPTKPSPIFPWLYDLMENAGARQNSSVSKNDVLSDIDCSPQFVNCGYHKCMYQSKKDASTGYLITTSFNVHRTWKRGTFIEIMNAGWYAANFFQETYGNIKHSLLSPPMAFNMTEEEAKWLEFKCSKPYWNHGGKVLKDIYKGKAGRKLIVQPVKVVDPSSIVLGCGSIKDTKTRKNWRDFVDKYVETIDVDLFLKGMESTEAIARDYPLFWEDFHVFVSAKGEVVQMDTDRFFQVPSREEPPGKKKKPKKKKKPGVPLVEGKALFRRAPDDEEQQACRSMLEDMKRLLVETVRSRK